MVRRLVLPLLLALPAATAGCAGGDDGRAPAPQREAGARERRPALPAGWTRAVGDAGFSLGVPPSWRARPAAGGGQVIRGPGGAVAVFVSIDRSDEARDQPLRAYARETLRALDGFGPRGVVPDGGARRLRGTAYPEAVTITGRGRFARTGAHQRVRVALLRPARQGASVFVVFLSARARADAFAGELGRMVASYRVEPPRSAQRSGRSG